MYIVLITSTKGSLMKAGTLFTTNAKNVFALSIRDGESLTGEKYIFVKLSNIDPHYGGIYFDMTEKTSWNGAAPRVSGVAVLVDAEGRSVNCVDIDLHAVATVFADGIAKGVFIKHASQHVDPMTLSLDDFSNSILQGKYGVSNYFVRRVGHAAQFVHQGAMKYRIAFEKALVSLRLEFDTVYTREFLDMVENYLRNLRRRK